MNIKTDILYFSKKEGKRIKLKDCELVTEFTFSKTLFFALKKNKYVFICCSNNGDLILIKNYKNIQPYEAASQFRTEYFKNKITKERLDLFLENPIEHEKKYKVKNK